MFGRKGDGSLHALCLSFHSETQLLQDYNRKIDVVNKRERERTLKIYNEGIDLTDKLTKG